MKNLCGCSEIKHEPCVSRRSFLKVAVGVSVMLPTFISKASAVSSDTGPKKQPNVIYIKTDDQRRDSLSMTGHPVTLSAARN